MTEAPPKTKPDGPQHARELIARGKLDAAERACVARLATNPGDHDALYWHAVATAERGLFRDAVRLLERAIVLDAGVAEYHAQLGRCLVGLRQVTRACAAADVARALRPGSARTLDTLGVIYSFAGQHEQAAECLARAVEIEPGNASYWFNLGASSKFNGDFERAEAAYERALELDPQLDKAMSALSHLRRQTADSNHVVRLQNRLGTYKGSLQNEMRLAFALAKEYDDLGEYQAAFELLSDVSSRWRASIRYDISDDAKMFSALTEGFNSAAVSNAAPGHDSEEPIFIVGMPRTGTTLTERIISSHSAVYAAGELNQFGTLIRIAAEARANPDFDAARVQRVLRSDLSRLGEAYIRNTRPATGNTPRFIDKMPLNFLYAGFIALALPRARILCVRRNPLDTCLSNFRQLFSLRSAYYAYSYDLLDCGRYYLLFDRLMRHWDELFPGRILSVQYENLVADQEEKSRELVAFCGLDWEDACLTFERNTAPVATASSAQVREPIYKTAVARWKNYANELQPLAEFLTANGVTID